MKKTTVRVKRLCCSRNLFTVADFAIKYREGVNGEFCSKTVTQIIFFFTNNAHLSLVLPKKHKLITSKETFRKDN